MLKDLLEGLDYKLLQGNLDQDISHICYDSRLVQSGDMFVCLCGLKDDGHCFIEQAIRQGAKVIMIEKMVPCQEGVTYIKVENTRYALAILSCAFFHYPSHQMTVIGITGTKGKTTVAYMIRSILKKANKKVGMIGTTGTYIHDKHYPTHNTTPESYDIQCMMNKMIEAHCEYCVMEVSSQGLMLDRVTGIDFDYGIFTNLSEDHIGEGEHHSFEEYMNCKKKLFQMCKIGLFNQDDPYYLDIIQNIDCQIKTYSLYHHSDIKAKNIQPLFSSQLAISFQTQGSINTMIECGIPGYFNVYNALAAIFVCQDLDIPLCFIQGALQSICIPGRLQRVAKNAPYYIMIDYAHNAYAYENLFQMLHDYHPHHIYCIYGAGGHRDKHRRYEVGKIVAKHHGISIVTADNPRGENILDICQDIIKGIKEYDGKYVVIEDRKEAIYYALNHAKKGDFVLCLGKGHEDYQIIGKERLPFSERKIIEEYFK
jgi:UDP-N-acetylmuramyl-tripeptide synthetase